MKVILRYDSSFEGLLCCVFYSYEHKLQEVKIEKDETYEPSFFGESLIIPSEKYKALRVWKGLSKKLTEEGKLNLYKAYLSEQSNIENTILYFIQKSIHSKYNIEKDFSDPHVLLLEKTVKKVNREKHRMDAFVRFRLTQDNIYFSTVEPDFNVLPLNAAHFKARYADQKWLIYDLKRQYGIWYDLNEVQTVSLELDSGINSEINTSLYFTDEEESFQKLWSNYFNSSNIATRKNMRLHIKHIPKRYWKYLSEKNC